MGHERESVLPKTQKWRTIVQQIGSVPVSETSRNTIQNVREQFRRLTQDEGVFGAFQFLVNLAVASRNDNPLAWLQENGIELPENPTAFAFARAINAYVSPQRSSLEYSEIAQKAASDAISSWYSQNQPKMASLFESLEDPFEVWRKAGDGAGFCELSRLFFANLTHRYLEYFLEREASEALDGIDERNEFGQQLEKHVDTISLHAFESAKITQSFAAGWFNNHAREGVPSKERIRGFLSLALGKMRDELQREGDEE